MPQKYVFKILLIFKNKFPEGIQLQLKNVNTNFYGSK